MSEKKDNPPPPPLQQEQQIQQTKDNPPPDIQVDKTTMLRVQESYNGGLENLHETNSADEEG